MEDLGVTAPHSAPSKCKCELLLCRKAAGNHGGALIVGLCRRCAVCRGESKGLKEDLDGGDGCVGWEAGVLRDTGMGAGLKDVVTAAMRRVRAAHLRSVCGNLTVVLVTPGAVGCRQIQTHSSTGMAAASAFPR